MQNIGGLTVTTPSEREIMITRAFGAPRSLVFDAWTKPEFVQRWLLGPPGWTMPVCEIDLRVGGSFRYVWRGPEGEQMAMGGVYREVEPPDRIVSTELYDEDWTGGETLNTLLFNEQDGRTTVTLTMLFASREARDGALSSGMEQGMAAGFDRLDGLLREPA
jgi:uncharacterized protein YndB with AHSA1/START domain